MENVQHKQEWKDEWNELRWPHTQLRPPSLSALEGNLRHHVVPLTIISVSI